MQVILPPELESMVTRQLTNGKYSDAMAVIRAAILRWRGCANELLDQQEASIYQGKLEELRQIAQVGWEASQQGNVVDGNVAMKQIRTNLQSRYQTKEQ
jgi:antitoxin ParD1/3/4